MLFWNRQEKRLRAFWRLLFQFFLFFITAGVIEALLALGVVLVANSRGDLQGIPYSFFGSAWFLLASAVISLAALFVSLLVAARWFDRRKLSAYGFHFSQSWWRDLGFGLILGAVLMGFIFGVELLAGWVTVSGTFTTVAGESFIVGILQAGLAFLCVGIYEETLARGYQLRNLAEGLNFTVVGQPRALLAGYLLSSIIFGLMHGQNPNITAVSVFNLVLAGLFLGLGYILTGELGLSIGIHITWNFFEGNVFGFAVSGTQAGASFIAIHQTGPFFLTGGNFGPEGGLIGVLATLIGCLAVVAWVSYTRHKITLQDRLALFQNEKLSVPGTLSAKP